MSFGKYFGNWFASWFGESPSGQPEQPAHGTAVEYIDRTPLWKRRRTMRALLMAMRQ